MQELSQSIGNAQLLVGIAQIFGVSVVLVFGLAYFLFRTLSTNWLETRFQERLESYKHAQQKEIEELRLRINTQFDRTIKLHQREFEVLPEAWAKLIDSYYHAISLTSLSQDYPAVDKMTKSELEEFLKTCSLTDHEKQELRMAPDKLRYYIDNIFWVRLNKSRELFTIVDAYVIKNGIVLPQELKDTFNKLTETIWQALTECESNKRDYSLRRSRTDQEKLRTEGKELLDELQAKVQLRVWGKTLGDSGP